MTAYGNRTSRQHREEMPAEQVRQWRRIAIIGSGGAGKSTLARGLGATLDLPVVHLDSLFWGPDWTEMPQEQWRARQQEMVQSRSWIIDGTHAPSFDVRLGAADAIVILDVNRFVCTWSVVKRRFAYCRKDRIDRAPGCREHLDAKFLRWVWRYPSHGRPEALAAAVRHSSHADVIRLRSRRAMRRLLSQLQSQPEGRARVGALAAA